jgi:hypothetical protein
MVYLFIYPKFQSSDSHFHSSILTPSPPLPLPPPHRFHPSRMTRTKEIVRIQVHGAYYLSEKVVAHMYMARNTIQGSKWGRILCEPLKIT